MPTGLRILRGGWPTRPSAGLTHAALCEVPRLPNHMRNIEKGFYSLRRYVEIAINRNIACVFYLVNVFISEEERRKMNSGAGGGAGGGGEDGRDGQPRQVQDMQSLLRLCVQASGDSGGNEQQGLAIDEERKAWLEEALKSMSVDVVRVMLENIDSIKAQLQTLSKSTRVEAECDEALDNIVFATGDLLERIQDLDLASDFHKIGGYEILVPMLTSPYPQLKMKGAELVGELVQNHKYCQNSAVNLNIVGTLIGNMNDEDVSDDVKVKTLYALSCLIRNNSYAQRVFKQKNGYSALLRAMQSTSEEGPKLRTKSAFLLGSIIRESPDIKNTLFQMGFIEQIVALLHFEHDMSHEHLLSALLNFVSDFEQGVSECRRPELALRSLLQNRIAFLNKQPEHQEEESYCNQLLNLCFITSTDNTDLLESER